MRLILTSSLAVHWLSCELIACLWLLKLRTRSGSQPIPTSCRLRSHETHDYPMRRMIEACDHFGCCWLVRDLHGTRAQFEVASEDPPVLDASLERLV